MGDVRGDDRPRPKVDRRADRAHSPAFTFSVHQQVATRRYVDEQAVWPLMRFADERAERAPSRQLTRAETRDARPEPGEFDRAVERLGDADE
jgi:hypothetical protein